MVSGLRSGRGGHLTSTSLSEITSIEDEAVRKEVAPVVALESVVVVDTLFDVSVDLDDVEEEMDELEVAVVVDDDDDVELELDRFLFSLLFLSDLFAEEYTAKTLKLMEY